MIKMINAKQKDLVNFQDDYLTRFQNKQSMGLVAIGQAPQPT